jgi:dihydropteroate synthase
MGVLNATPDSFSDAGRLATEAARLARLRELVSAGADIVDVGGEAAVTDRPAVAAPEEIDRVVPLIERAVAELGALVSVDTHKPAVAAAAIAAGAGQVNEPPGLRDPAMADLCASTGAGLVIMHTLAEPKQRRQDAGLYGEDIAAEVAAFLAERVELAVSRGVHREQLLLDPGPDFAKTPAQTVRLLRDLGPVRALGRPLLLAVSRKDFVGALVGRPPGQRLAGTLAAVSHGLDQGAQVLRVHDVAAVADYLSVRAALRGEDPVADTLTLAEELRREPAGPPAS